MAYQADSRIVPVKNNQFLPTCHTSSFCWLPGKVSPTWHRWLSVCLRCYLRTKTTTTTAVCLLGHPRTASRHDGPRNTLFAVWWRDLRLQVDVWPGSGHLRTPPGFLSYLGFYLAVWLQSLSNAGTTRVWKTPQHKKGKRSCFTVRSPSTFKCVIEKRNRKFAQALSYHEPADRSDTRVDTASLVILLYWQPVQLQTIVSKTMDHV